MRSINEVCETYKAVFERKKVLLNGYELTSDGVNWIVNNNYFNKVKLVAVVHDEICCEYPKELVDFPKLLEKTMEEASTHYCKFSKIPAESSVGFCWIH